MVSVTNFLSSFHIKKLWAFPTPLLLVSVIFILPGSNKNWELFMVMTLLSVAFKLADKPAAHSTSKAPLPSASNGCISCTCARGKAHQILLIAACPFISSNGDWVCDTFKTGASFSLSIIPNRFCCKKYFVLGWLISLADKLLLNKVALTALTLSMLSPVNENSTGKLSIESLASCPYCPSGISTGLAFCTNCNWHTNLLAASSIIPLWLVIKFPVICNVPDEILRPAYTSGGAKACNIFACTHTEVGTILYIFSLGTNGGCPGKILMVILKYKTGNGLP